MENKLIDGFDKLIKDKKGQFSSAWFWRNPFNNYTFDYNGYAYEGKKKIGRWYVLINKTVIWAGALNNFNEFENRINHIRETYRKKAMKCFAEIMKIVRGKTVFGIIKNDNNGYEWRYFDGSHDGFSYGYRDEIFSHKDESGNRIFDQELYERIVYLDRLKDDYWNVIVKFSGVLEILVSKEIDRQHVDRYGQPRKIFSLNINGRQYLLTDRFYFPNDIEVVNVE